MAGLQALRDDAEVLIIVDVLSFSTAVDIAVSRGVSVLPFPLGNIESAGLQAAKQGALLALPRKKASGGPSLSPASLMDLDAGSRLLLPSPNGSRLSTLCIGKTAFTCLFAQFPKP